jgi:hypothetical protein
MQLSPDGGWPALAHATMLRVGRAACPLPWCLKESEMNSVKTPIKSNSEEQERSSSLHVEELEFWDRVHADAWNVDEDEDAAEGR